MRVVGLVSPGAMGSGVGAAYAAAGLRAVATVAGRSERTARLAAGSGLELVPALDDVVAAADLVLSIVPPAEAPDAAARIAAAARRTGARPLVADLNAVSPATMREIERLLRETGLDVVDGSISGGVPGRARRPTRIYLSGARAAEVAALAAPGLEPLVVAGGVGAASAVKMSTAAVYKGTVAVLAHALAAARANGVLAEVLDDLGRGDPELVERAHLTIQSAASKAWRHAGEMREIAATQGAAGLTPALYEGFAAAYEALARTELARLAPEEVDHGAPLEQVLERLRPQ